MAKAVKSYLVSHNQQYREAMKRTGPIDTSKVYMNNRPSSHSNAGHDTYQRSSIVNMDDPYWQDYYKRNYRTQDKYKLPSIYAWDYKEHGILGEVIDMKKLQRNLKEM